MRKKNWTGRGQNNSFMKLTVKVGARATISTSMARGNQPHTKTEPKAKDDFFCIAQS